MAQMRLQKFISEAGITSRRKAEKLITSGQVKINGKIITELGTKIDPSRDKIYLNNKLIKQEEKGLILLNKPTGCITSKSDPKGRKTVLDFVSKKYQSYNPVGRLDYNTSGLLLLTNDGELAAMLTHPRYGFTRVYHVEVRGLVPEKVITRIQRGVKLEDGSIKAKARILKNKDSSCVLELCLNEGRNRIVRRLMKKLGYPVIHLKRVSFGPFKLGRLRVGEIKKYSEREYKVVRKRVLEEVAE